MNKQLHWIKSKVDKNGNRLILWHTGNYEYQIDAWNGDSFSTALKIDGDCEEAIDLLESLAVL
jgi:hypothetical protein